MELVVTHLCVFLPTQCTQRAFRFNANSSCIRTRHRVRRIWELYSPACLKHAAVNSVRLMARSYTPPETIYSQHHTCCQG